MSGADNTSYTVRTVTAATTLTANDSVLLVTAGAAFSVTLPNADAIQPGRQYTIIKDAGANIITIATTGGDTINGAASDALAASAFHGMTVVSNGTNWFIVAEY